MSKESNVLTLVAEADKETLYGTHTRADVPMGWRWLDTPGHGYLYPSEDANKRVPAFLRGTRYEEDLDYNIPILFNSHLFTRQTVEYAQAQFKDYYYKAYEKVFKVTLTKGESAQKDREYFLIRENENNYLLRCAMGDWCYDVPKGMVYVEVVKINKELSYEHNQMGVIESFLIRSEDYKSRQMEILKKELLTPYQRDEEFYTWEQYGKPRFK